MTSSLAKLCAGTALIACLPTMAFASASYVATSLDKNSIYFLDQDMKPLSSFAVKDQFPNGVSSNGSLIFAAYFTDLSVVAYNYAGVEQFRWSNPGLYRVQGITLVDNKYIAAATDDRLTLFDVHTGNVTAQLSLGDDTVEGLAYDGHYLWSIGSQLVARDFVTGKAVKSIPNAAFGCPFAGTGIAADRHGALTLGCSDGHWFKVSASDGSVIASGTNGIDMFDLACVSPVPEPATAALTLAGLAAVGVARRRRR